MADQERFDSLLHQLNWDTVGIAVQDPACREILLQSCRSIVAKLEKPEDQILETAFSPNVNMAFRVCIDLNIFTILSHAKEPMRSSSLAQLTGAEEVLLIRFMCAICAVNFPDFAGVNTYAANSITKAMALPAWEAGSCVAYDNVARPKSNTFNAVQTFKQNSYQSPTSALDGPYQHANDCVGTSAFDHWIQDPTESLRFNTYIEVVHSGHPM